MQYEELIRLIRDPDLDVGIYMTGTVHNTTDRSMLPSYLQIDKDSAEKFVLACCEYHEKQGVDPNCLDFKVVKTATGVSFLPTGIVQ